MNSLVTHQTWGTYVFVKSFFTRVQGRESFCSSSTLVGGHGDSIVFTQRDPRRELRPRITGPIPTTPDG